MLEELQEIQDQNATTNPQWTFPQNIVGKHYPSHYNSSNQQGPNINVKIYERKSNFPNTSRLSWEKAKQDNYCQNGMWYRLA